MLCAREVLVIPLFVSQIKSDKQITITDPEMTRYLMSLEQSVELVMHALVKENQEIFLFKNHLHVPFWIW